MPELPEVETIRLGLQKTIINQTISDIQIHLPKMFSGDSATTIGTTVTNVERRGKLLIITTKKNEDILHLLIHLKMTGQLIFQSKNTPGFAGGHPIPPLNTPIPNKSTKITINFNSGDILYFNDLRTFGYIKLVTAEQLNKNSFLQKVGIEPLTGDFTPEKLKDMLGKRPNMTLKSFLLDQSYIAGLGNIYTDESLFLAKILPWRAVKSITEEEIEKLHNGIVQVLKDGIELQGASKTSYVSIDGSRGTFLAKSKVYQRHGSPCMECSTLIKKIKLNGRGTHYCPECQI